MHIIFITPEMPTKEDYGGGLATFTTNIAEIFAAHGNRVEIIHVTTIEQRVEYDCKVEVRNIYIPKKEWQVYSDVSQLYYEDEKADENRREMLSVIKAKAVRDEITQINKQEKVDIVHFCNHGSLSMMMDDTIPYCIRISGFLNICLKGADTVTGSIRYQDNPLSVTEKLENYAMKKAKFVFAPSRFLAQIGKENLGINIDVLESPFMLGMIENREEVLKKYSLHDKKYLLFHGTLRYSKGIQVIANMVESVLAKYPDIYFVLAGSNRNVKNSEGNMIEASEYVKERAGIYRDRVLYLGRVPRTQIYAVISKSEACVLPSRMENLSNACISSMAMERIVIATKGISFEQLIIDGKNGFLCERDNVDEFIKCIEYVLSLPEERKAIIQSEAGKTIERLSPDKVYDIFLKYYKKVIDKFNC